MKTILFSFLIMTSSICMAGVDDIKRLKKCYGVFVSEQIQVTHPLMVKVLAGTLNGADACMQLLSNSNFGSDNTIGKESNGKFDREKQKVLRNMHYMHRSFFGVLSYDDLSDMVNLDTFSKNLFDINSDSYYWTYAFFKPGVKASSVITADHSMFALRHAENQAEQKLNNLGDGDKYTSFGDWPKAPENFVEQGLLIGVKRDPRVFYADLSNNYWSGEMNGSNANRHFGAGVIGSQVYMFSNFGRHGKQERSTGGDKVYRRWSQHVLKDILCKDLPALRIEDGQSEVEPESPFFFRKSASCMQCHSSMDPMAAYVRNIRTSGVNTGFRPFFAHAYPVTKEPLSTILPKQVDSDFYSRPPDGRLMFRSYDGTLIKNPSRGLSSLGTTIASTNDFYACAVKKYYEKLTGVNVSLNDIGAPEAAVLNDTEKKHRQRVIDLGIKLKNDQNQNIQSIIKDIISTDTFVNSERF